MNKKCLEHILLVGIMGILTGFVLVQANPTEYPPTRDGGMYAYIGSKIIRGELPYLQVWDHKPPGVFYLNALALYLGHGNRWGIWLLEFSSLLVAACLGYYLMFQRWGPFAALFGTLLWLLGLNATLFGGNYTEEYSLPLGFLALWLYSSSLDKKKTQVYDLLIGVTGGLSFLLRANNIGPQLTIGLVILICGVWQKEFLRVILRLLLIGVGLLLPILLVAGYFASQQALRPMLDAALVYNFSYTGNQADLWLTLITGIKTLNVAVIVALAGYLSIVVAILKRPVEFIWQWHLVLLVGLPIEIALSSLSGRAYRHYFICWLPFIGLLCAQAGYIYGKWPARVFSSQPLSLTYSFTLFILLAAFSSDLAIYQKMLSHWWQFGHPSVRVDPVVVYIQSNTRPDDKVLVWGGEVGINFSAKRDAPTPHFLYPLFTTSPMAASMADQFLEDLQQNPPALIVDAYFYATDNEVLYSLDRGIRSEQMQQITPDSRVFVTPNLEDVFAFIENYYHLETTVAETNIYRKNP